MSNVARELIWPTDNDVAIRAVFLYVGQGDCTALLVRDGDGYRCIVVDINVDSERGGIDVPALAEDLLADSDGRLDVFVNTHPHSDHLRGVKELSESVAIGAVWHSGHEPGKKHADAYSDLESVIKSVTEAGGTELQLLGSRSPKALGDCSYYVLSPAEYVVDEIEGESAEERYRRIHEQCAVLKFGLDETWLMITGDADRDAWEKHITDYHAERLPAAVLSAPHHGSRTFFRYKEDDEPYLDALEGINPDYVVISAPTPEESPHDHPHEDAVELYADAVGADGVVHTGARRYSFFCDIFDDGQLSIYHDNGELAKAYPAGDSDDDGDDGDDGKGKLAGSAAVIVGTSRVDERPMG